MSDTVSYILKASTTQILGSMVGILKKAAAHAEAVKVDPAVFLAARVYPDMHAVPRQVQIACDTVARGAARLAGADMPSFPDTETTIDELIARCTAAIAFVEGVDSAAIDANATATLQIPMGPDAVMPMEGRQYLSSFVLPNLHFHATVVYTLLRGQGVAIGKRDFLMPG